MKPTEITIKEFLAINSIYGMLIGIRIRESIIDATKFDIDKRKSLIKSLKSIEKFIDITDKRFEESQLPSLRVNIYSDLRDDLIFMIIGINCLYSIKKETCPVDIIERLKKLEEIVNNFIKKIEN